MKRFFQALAIVLCLSMFTPSIMPIVGIETVKASIKTPKLSKGESIYSSFKTSDKQIIKIHAVTKYKELPEDFIDKYEIAVDDNYGHNMFKCYLNNTTSEGITCRVFIIFYDICHIFKLSLQRRSLILSLVSWQNSSYFHNMQNSSEK